MNTLFIIVLIILISIILGVIKFKSVYAFYDFKADKINPPKNAPWQLKFAEIWNDTVNFLLAGLTGYYFVLVRWPLLIKGDVLNVADFILFIIFSLGLFGHLSVMSKNITDGINAILKRVLDH